MEWVALLIPVIGIIVLRWKFSAHMHLAEYCLPLLVTLAFILGIRSCGQYSMMRDTEYWGGVVTQATFYEDWDERVPCRHPIPCSHTRYCTSTDSKGNTTTYPCGTEHFNDGYYHAYDVDYHPEEWCIEDTNGAVWGTSQAEFNNFVAKFKNKSFVELNRDFHEIDGDSYVTTWPKQWETLTPTTVQKSYLNKVAVSKSVYSYPVVSKKKTPVFDYPEPKHLRCPSVLSKVPLQGVEELEKLNGLLGPAKQVRIWLLVWQDVPRQVGLDQEAYWKGSNKNELVICTSVDKDLNIQWTHVFSWSKSENLKVAVKSFLGVDNRKLDLKTLVPFLQQEVNSKWVRRRWEDFDYLTVEVPKGAIIAIFIVSTIATVGVGIFCVQNGLDNTDVFSRHY
jgi:hypothetical protein